jgi:hypothetical protein
VEIEADVQEAIEQTEDLLHADTAAVFAGVIELGRRMAQHLAGLENPEIQGLVVAFTRVAAQAEVTLAEITIPDQPDDGRPENDEDGDDEDEDDDEEDDDAADH